MAFEVKKIDPLDLQPRKAVGIDIPFSGKAVFNSTYQTKDAIRANLINFFLTGTGERFMNPTFGTGLRNFLFENLNESTIRNVDSSIRNSLEIYFPRVIPTEISLEGIPDTNSVEFFMSYAIAETNIEDELIINIET